MDLIDMAFVPPSEDKEALSFEHSADRANARSDEWKKTWIFSLGVANGGAMLAVANAVLDKKAPMLLVSGWCFMVGLLAAGSLPFLLMASNSEWASYWFAQAKLKRGYQGKFLRSDLTEHSAQSYSEVALRRYGRFTGLERIATCLSSLFFVCGCTWGLIVLGRSLQQL